ncbi:5-dehydro-4-deoxy-D-glucuronate isomerase [Labilibaculum sp. K2S]|uniref:5-dehydro-4-deoxy-D-glucuronate isomerase n=1 Tax=Labilibaculum sp. K2S TaxID=3056386 RepID=UPI0025A3749D|nr:5-dehydro-4-deoxy-D-glucuronate isomerase [Labilibaculum sp. K2S]MDM8158258.1 5-dehydro-4-deoxy-D-glucuronate isomerase [Labilibaculum sp. K2S]
MGLKYEERYATHPADAKSYDTSRLRDEYLVQNLMEEGSINLTYSQYDRIIVGGAVPVKEALTLESIDPLKADYFLERRELGIVNVGGKGSVSVDGAVYELDYKEALYLGKGNKEIIFASTDAASPAHFYLNSAPAHEIFPNVKVGLEDAIVIELGEAENSNRRTLRKLIVSDTIKTNQLQMGMTELHPGSVWNTMPAHTHSRRMEAYFYFEVPKGQAICHFMGDPKETRHIWMANEEAVFSPTWSIHSAAGTSNYTFIWGMGGENLNYGDMDICQPDELR